MRIAFSDMDAYSRLMRFSFTQTQDFILYVERLDTKFMEWIAEEAEKDKNKPRSRPGT